MLFQKLLSLMKIRLIAMGTLFLNLYSTSPPHKLFLLEVTIIVKKINIYDYFSRDIPRKNFDRSDEEKEKLLKEFGFEKEKKGYTFSHNVFSRAFRRYVIIKLLQNNEPVIYNQKHGIYERDCSETIEKLIKYCMNLVYDLWCPYYAQVALKTIVHDTFDVVQQFNSGDYINLRNGVLDLNTYSMNKHSPDYYSTVQLPFEYSTASPTPVFNRFMEDITCGDKDMQLLLQEMMGYCLCTSTAGEKAFYLYGSGANGKSVFAQILQCIVGEDNYSSATLTALNGTFGLASLINANVNIAAENNNGRVNSEIFKAIVSGDVVEVNRKYRDAISVKLHTKLVLLFNELPDSTDLTYGYFRKIILIPFRKTVSKEEMDVELINKLKLELSGIFHWAVEGLKRLRGNSYKFTYCQACEDALDAYKQTLNPIAAFFEQYFEVNSSASIKKSDIYKIYSEYCYANAVECYPCQKFWRLLKAHCADKNYQFATKKIRGYEYLVGLKAK